MQDTKPQHCSSRNTNQRTRHDAERETFTEVQTITHQLCQGTERKLTQTRGLHIHSILQYIVYIVRPHIITHTCSILKTLHHFSI